MPIVEHQPNKNFIENLKPGSLFLRNLQQKLTRAASQLRGSRVVSIAELGMSKTAKQLPSGEWKLQEGKDYLVTRESAWGVYPSELKVSSMAFSRNHLDLPKFSGVWDEYYREIMNFLKQFSQTAVTVVKERFQAAGASVYLSIGVPHSP